MIYVVWLIIIIMSPTAENSTDIDWCKKCRAMETYYYTYCTGRLNITNDKWDGLTPEEFCDTYTMKDVMLCIFEHGVAPCDGTKEPMERIEARLTEKHRQVRKMIDLSWEYSR
jgi:hypothetical protein